MLRTLLIYLSKAHGAQSLVTRWGFAWRTASRFIAGTKIEDAIKVIRELNARGINVTLDHLGEHTSSTEEASDATLAIIRTLGALKKSGLCANVSIKLSQIGLGLDENVCRQNLERILAKAKEYHNFVRIDMEDTPYTDQTLNLCRYENHSSSTMRKSHAFAESPSLTLLVCECHSRRAVGTLSRMSIFSSKPPWYIAGLAFECGQCGGCCAGPEEGFIWITDEEIELLAAFLGKPPEQVRSRYTRRAGRRQTILEDEKTHDCIFLTVRVNDKGQCGRGCAIYEVRPTQCRTWPFWPTNVSSPDDWACAAGRCPGINRGSIHPFDEIEAKRQATER